MHAVQSASPAEAGSYDGPGRVGTPLTREKYLALGPKLAPTFTTAQRSTVYEIYDKYDKLMKKDEAHFYDAADVVCHIARAQRQRTLGAGPQALAHVFVDEVQDLTQAELLLLVQALARPGGGLFLAGDTAQAITAGVGFRFQDTKSLLHNFAKDSSSGSAPALGWAKPELRALTVNYRAQSGLVDCAAAVGELLVSLFPGSVDALPRERGFFRGSRVRMERATEPTDIMLKFVPPGAGSDDVSVFGARQAVLVRSVAARQRLAREQPWLSDLGATILTVEESKGLEFDDVFLFDFFRDSECDSEWLVVAHAAMQRWDGDIHVPADGARRMLSAAAAAAARARRERCARHASELDARAHGRLLLELQLLYVALFRGRRRVFVFDTDDDKRAPMFAFLASPVGDVAPPVALMSDDVDEELSDDDDGDLDADLAMPGRGALLGSNVGADSRAEWQAQGAGFLANGLFAAAATAFFKAGNHDGGWRATGAELFRRADEAAAGAPARAKALRLRAANAYAKGHAPADVLAAARLAGDAQLLAALEQRAA